MEITIYTNLLLTDKHEVKRTIKERFLTWPWKPWVKTKTIEVPSRKMFLTQGLSGPIIICHPDMEKEIKSKLGHIDHNLSKKMPSSFNMPWRYDLMWPTPFV